MGALAGVFFKVSALNSDALATWQFKPTINVDRLVVLRDLIGLWHIGIEVVLAVKSAWLHFAVESKSNTHRELNCLTVENWQGTRKSESYRINVCVRIIAKTVRACRKQLCCGGKFDVNFKTTDKFVTIKQVRTVVGRNLDFVLAHVVLDT